MNCPRVLTAGIALSQRHPSRRTQEQSFHTQEQAYTILLMVALPQETRFLVPDTFLPLMMVQVSCHA